MIAHQIGIYRIGPHAVPVAGLRAHPPAEDSATVKKFRADIRAGRHIDPIEITKAGVVINGHHRLEAFKAEGKRKIPAIII